MQRLLRGLSSLLPPIRVHSWGGLGSQLFAYVTFLRISQAFPSRRVVLVHHTGGVTRRDYALGDLIPLKNLLVRDDFKPGLANPVEPIKHSFKFKCRGNKIRRLVKVNLIKLRIIVNLNSNEEYKYFRVWTLETRGHYSKIAISPGEASLLVKLFLDTNSSAFHKQSPIFLHWRLGDLTDIETKNAVSSQRVLNAIRICQAKIKISDSRIPELVVMSDSFPLAIAQLGQATNSLDLILHSTKSIDLQGEISEAIRADYFIGTNSKLSIWIVIFRKLLNPESKNFMCLEVKTAIECNLSSEFRYLDVDYF